MSFAFDLNKPLEQNVQSYLTAVREADSVNYRVTMFALYTDLKKSMATVISSIPPKHGIVLYRNYYRDNDIPVAFFNKTIGDLKKVGIIGTCKGGEEVFLSNAAWELHVTSTAVKP